MQDKEIFERLKEYIISTFREDIIIYQNSIWDVIDVYIWVNIQERKVIFFFTNPEDLDENDILLFKIKSDANEKDFQEIENYLKNLEFDFLPILQFNPKKYEYKRDYLWEEERWTTKWI